MDEITIDDDDICLEDIDGTMSEIRLKMISTATRHCSVEFANHKMTLPCHPDTLINTIVKEFLQKLHLSNDNINMYELIALDDERSQIDFDLTVESILELLFPMGSTRISIDWPENSFA